MATVLSRNVVTAADANRKFSELLRDVRNGRTVTITVHGKSVAKMVPLDEGMTGIDEARRTLLGRLKRQRAVHAGAWTRESLYDK